MQMIGDAVTLQQLRYLIAVAEYEIGRASGRDRVYEAV